MADIGITLDPSAPAPEIHDEALTKDPYEGAGWVERNIRYAWLTVHARGGDEIKIHLAYGLATDEQIIASTEPLIHALEQMRDAARDRIADREFRQKLLDSPDCARCGRPCIDHEDQAGACPGERGWYRAPADEPEPGPDGDELTRLRTHGLPDGVDFVGTVDDSLNLVDPAEGSPDPVEDKGDHLVVPAGVGR